jgi:hypothetical protein
MMSPPPPHPPPPGNASYRALNIERGTDCVLAFENMNPDFESFDPNRSGYETPQVTVWNTYKTTFV